jgi:hypothetical protein
MQDSIEIQKKEKAHYFSPIKRSSRLASFLAQFPVKPMLRFNRFLSRNALFSSGDSGCMAARISASSVASL